MFTPKFVSEERGEFVLVSNHALNTPEQIAMSVAYNLAPVNFGRAHLPTNISQCRIIYDIRGQYLPDEILATINSQLSVVAHVEIKS